MRLTCHRSTVPQRLACLLIGLVLALPLACQSDEEKITSFLQNGDQYAEKGQWNEAVIEFRNALQLAPNDAEAHHKLANAYLALQKGKQAYWELSETVRLDPSNVDARLALGGLLLMARDFEGAGEQAQAIAELEPDHPDAQVMLGQAYEGQGRAEEAEPLYLRAIESAPDKPIYLFMAATYYQRAHDREAAEPLLVKYVEATEAFDAYSAYGRFLSEDEERSDEMFAAFDKAAELAKTPNEISAAHRNLSSAYAAREQPDDAVAMLQQGIEKLPDESQQKLDLMYYLARYYRGLGRKEDSDALISKAAEIQPDSVQPHLVLSARLGRDGDFDGALEEADRALELAPNETKPKLRKAELLVDVGYRREDPAMVEEGLAIVEGVLLQEPTSPDALFVKGKVALAQQDPQGAVEALRAAVDQRPNWAQAHFVLGSALMLSRDATGARAEMARAVELDPSLHEARRMLAQLHAGLGEYEYAVEQGRIYLRENPNHTTTRILVAQSLVRIGRQQEALAELAKIPPELEDEDVLFAKGRLYQAIGDAEEARRLLLAANEKSPNTPQILRALLVLDQQEDRLADSVARIDAALAAKPNDAGLLRLRGAIELANRDMAAAEATFRAAIEADPKNLDAYQQLASVLQATGRLDETLELYKSALAERPDSAELHHFLGVLYEMGGKIDLARREYETAIELDDDMAQSKNNLAYLLAEAGEDLDRALTLAQEAKALMPDSASAADTLGWVLYRRGIASAAVGYLREAVAGMDPKSPSIGIVRHHLAQAYEANDQKSEAVDTLETALADLEQQTAAVRKAGGEIEEPEWSQPAREMLARLKPAG